MIFSLSSTPRRSSAAKRPARSRIARRLCESLEPRTLLSVTTTPFSVTGNDPEFVTYDSSGNLWTVETNSNGATLLDEYNNSNSLVTSIDISNTSPLAVAYSPTNNHIYIADLNYGIDDVNLNDQSVTQYGFNTPFPVDFINGITVTGNGNVWFTNEYPNSDGTWTNVLGRWVPGSAEPTYTDFNSDVASVDTQLSGIASAGADSVWVGLAGVDEAPINGANRIGFASFDGTNFSETSWAVNSGNPITDANNGISGVASDGNGGAWVSLDNFDLSLQSPEQRTQIGPDTLLHVTPGSGGSINQTGIPLAGITSAQAQAISAPTVDHDGNVWFYAQEPNVEMVGVYDPTTASFTYTTYSLSGDEVPASIAASPTTDEATLALEGSSQGGFVRFDVQNSVTFSGTASNLSGQQLSTFNNVTLATFTAPALSSGNYTATISWGDGTPNTVVTAQAEPNNMYEIVISGKSFAQQGTYSGTITITDPSSNQVGTLNFQSVISDIPLNVTSFGGVDILAGITAAAGSFTDDPNLAVSTWTATINWGDGTTSNAAIVANPNQPGTYLIVGLHIYRRKGTYTLTLLVTTTEQNAVIENDTLTTTLVVR